MPTNRRPPQYCYVEEKKCRLTNNKCASVRTNRSVPVDLGSLPEDRDYVYCPVISALLSLLSLRRHKTIIIEFQRCQSEKQWGRVGWVFLKTAESNGVEWWSIESILQRKDENTFGLSPITSPCERFLCWLRFVGPMNVMAQNSQE
jgi:hypothetical protein